LTASTGTLTNPFQYAGRDLDSETGLFYNRYRFYDPTVGRFISEDPSGFGGGMNFYRYVNNSPTGSVDPLGLARCVLFVSNGMLWCFPQQPGHDAVIIDVLLATTATACSARTTRAAILCTIGDRFPEATGNGPPTRLQNRMGEYWSRCQER